MNDQEKIEKAIELLHEADGLMQQALGATVESYKLHTRISDIADDIENNFISK